MRNLCQHGSPLWPFTPGPWGDPRPEILDLVDTRFVHRPLDTLDGHLGVYSERVAGGWLLLLGSLVVLVGALSGWRVPRRLRLPLAVAGATALVSVVAFATVPGTGLPTTPGLFQPEGWPFSTLRYIQPTVFAATIAVAMAARAGRFWAGAATITLIGALAWNLGALAELGYPFAPSAGVVLLGALAGVLLLLATLLAQRHSPWRVPRPRPGWTVPLVVAGAVVLGVMLAQASDGFITRHTHVDGTTALGPDLVAWFTARPGFEDGHWPIAFIGRSLQGPLAGDHFTHKLELIRPYAPCSEVRAVARRAPVVVTDPGFLYKFIGVTSYGSHRCLSHRTPDYRDVAFRVYLP